MPIVNKKVKLACFKFPNYDAKRPKKTHKLNQVLEKKN